MTRTDLADLTSQLGRILEGARPRQEQARLAASAIRSAGGYRWVGLYDVGPQTIDVVGWNGPSAPTYPTFPVTQGVNGAAVASGEPVIVQDVTRDARYLTTLDGTRAEMIMPVRAGPAGGVVGTIDVESDRVNPFGESDRELLAACAGALVKLWRGAV